jgi:hypothetical protein
LSLLTLPGLRISSDWSAVHDLMLERFPQIGDVLATTIPSTVLVVHDDEPNRDAWIDAITVVIRRRMTHNAPPGSACGAGPAA